MSDAGHTEPNGGAVRAVDNPAPNSGQAPRGARTGPARRFYRIDSRAVTLREYWWGQPAAIAIAALLKLLRVRLPSSTDDPNVEALAPFEVAADAVDAGVSAQMAPLAEELQACGFHSPIYHVIEDDLHHAQTHLATFVHESGKAWARIHRRRWTLHTPAKEVLFTEIVTPFASGTFLWSLSSKPDMLAPANCRVLRRVGARPSELWAAHRAVLEKDLARRPIVPLTTPEAARVAVDRLHSTVRTFHVRRGVFVPLTEAERGEAAVNTARREAAQQGGSRHPQVLAEIQSLQARRSSGLSGILVLIVSAALFLGAFTRGSSFSLEYLAILVPVLLFHELGHWLAMRYFGYRNLRMFFIPFFGAAVSGRHYNVAAWKKAVVSLMGPLPGIMVGALLAALGMMFGKPLLLQIAITALILNGINLLPILPLDGGWVVQAILASRSLVFEVVFRVLAVAALLAAGAMLRDTPLLVLGGLMLVSLPAAYKIARITRDLRNAGLPPSSDDDQTIPPATAEAIVEKVAESLPARTTNRQLAESALAIFEALNARPPRLVASLGLGFVQLGGLAAAVVFAAVATIGQTTSLGGLMQAATELPPRALDPERVVEWRAAGAESLTDAPHDVVVASFETDALAEQASRDAQVRAQGRSAIATFGQSVLVALPAGDDAGRRTWLAAFEGKAQETFVATPETPAHVQLSCLAETEPAATAIEHDAGDYLLAPAEMKLVPPWVGEDARTPEERAAHSRARRTYARLVSWPSEAISSPGLTELPQKEVAALRAGDTAESARLAAERRRLMLDLRRSHVEAVLRSPDLDSRVAERYRALGLDTEAPQGAEQLTELAPLLGQLPLSGGAPDPKAGVLRASGFVGRTGLLLNMPFLRFESSFAGPPAMVRWLRSRGCTDFRYQLIDGEALASELEEEAG